MQASALRNAAPPLYLPPVFSWMAPPPGRAVHDFACEIAPSLGAGTLSSRSGEAVLEIAVVLEPDEPLRQGRRAILTCMSALADAVGVCAPPEMPVTLGWPDIIAFDGARIGGGRLGWPEGCAEEEIPDWLVFSAMLITSKKHAGDPGLTPGSTALDEEGFEPGAADGIVEAFARYLLLGFDALNEHGLDAACTSYLRRLPNSQGSRFDQAGNLVSADGARLDLAAALKAVSWFDAHTGAPRL
jgi:hypothetical protein